MRYVEITEAARKIPIFYHGSDHRIEEFTLDHLGTGKGHDRQGPGIYLSSSPEDAASYGKYIHTVRVNIPKNKFIGKRPITRAQIESLLNAAPKLQEKLINWDEDPKVAYQTAVNVIMSSYGDDMKEACEQIWYDFYYPQNTADYLHRMIEMGYDGISIPQANGVVHLIVFNPKCLQIVSVSENTK